MNILLVSRQFGTAYAFAPLAKFLENSTDIKFKIVGLEESWQVYSELGINFLRSSNEEVLDTVQNFDLVITGTSNNVLADSTIWHECLKKGVECAAFIDQWINLWPRFTWPKENVQKFNLLPQKVIAIDEFAKADLQEHGCPADRIIVAPSPALDLISSFSHPSKPADRKYILFVSTPFDIHTGRDELSLIIFEQFLKACMANMQQIKEKKKHIKVRLHPREKIKKWQFKELIQKSSLETTAISFSTSSKLDDLSNSALIVGSHTFLLYESSTLGFPTVAYQPILRPNFSYNLRPNQGSLVVAKTQKELEAAIFSGLAEPVKVKPTNNSWRFCQKLKLL